MKFVESKFLAEGANQSQVDYILKMGLAGDKEKLNYYRRVIKNPKASFNEPILRPYAGGMLETLLNILFTDTQVWNRVKTILTRKKQNTRGLREEVSDSGLRSLIEKSLESEIPLEIILEVYSRGANIGGEREGFGRVNSFIAGGKAIKLDEDLVATEPVIVEKKKTNVLSTVKRVLKEKKR